MFAPDGQDTAVADSDTLSIVPAMLAVPCKLLRCPVNNDLRLT